MESQSIREVIQTVESLEVDDEVRFEDENGTEYAGRVCELQPHQYDEHRDFLVKGHDGTEDCVLEVWYDIEGGPTHVAVSFEDGSSENVVAAIEE